MCIKIQKIFIHKMQQKYLENINMFYSSLNLEEQ